MGQRSQIRGSGGQATRMGNNIIVRQQPGQQPQQPGQAFTQAPHQSQLLYMPVPWPPQFAYGKQYPQGFSQVSSCCANVTVFVPMNKSN